MSMKSEVNMNLASDAGTTTYVIPLCPRGYHTLHREPAFSPTLSEERREVLESVMSGLRAKAADSDTRTACRFLLRHMAATAPNC